MLILPVVVIFIVCTVVFVCFVVCLCRKKRRQGYKLSKDADEDSVALLTADTDDVDDTR